MLVAVSPPTVEPVSLEEARVQCKADAGAEDALITGYQLAARQHVESETGRALITQTWELSLDSWPCSITLPKPPSLSVASIKYTNEAGAEVTLPIDQYQLVKLSTGEFEVVPAYGVSWPAVRAQRAAIRVRFVAGYGPAATDVPEPLRQAIKLLVGHWHANREAVDARGASRTLPLGVDALLFPYRIFY